jgi:excisionase family DNA binding protein
MQSEFKSLLTVSQAATVLNIGRTLLYRLMDQGELGYVKIGRTRRIRTADIDALVVRSYVGRSYVS